MRSCCVQYNILHNRLYRKKGRRGLPKHGGEEDLRRKRAERPRCTGTIRLYTQLRQINKMQ